MQGNGKKSGPLPDPPLRWTLRKAASEFGSHEFTIKGGLKNHGIMPGPDQKYSTREIAKAIFDAERFDAKTKEARSDKAVAEAERAQIEMLEQRGEVVRVPKLEEWLADRFAQIAQVIRHLPHLTTEQRQRMLAMLDEARFGRDEKAA